MSRLLSAFNLLAAVSLIGLLGGCMTPSMDDPARTGPFFVPSNHTGDAQLPPTIRRVVLLPAAVGNVAPPESGADLDPVLVTELQKRNRFEIVSISRAECRQQFRVEEFSTTGALPHDFMGVLRRRYAADAVLFVDVTVYKAYRPLAIGVRAKLATTGDDVRLLWTFDNVFSAADARVANSARRHFLESDRRGVPADITQGVLESPSQFAGYVAAETFATLPPVWQPAPPAGTEPPRKKTKLR